MVQWLDCSMVRLLDLLDGYVQLLNGSIVGMAGRPPPGHPGGMVRFDCSSARGFDCWNDGGVTERRSP